MTNIDIHFSDKIDQIFAAFAEAQAKFTKPEKTGKNPHFKSSYSTLEDIWDACKDPMAEHGLFVLQTLGYRDGVSLLITTLGHKSGQWIRGEGAIMMAKPDAQSMGSAITYMKRYSLSALIGVGCDDGCDDDGNEASRTLPAAKPQSVKKVAVVHIEDEAESFNQLHRLYDRMADKGLDISKILEFVTQKAKESGKSTDEVIESALSPHWFDKFCIAYAKHMERTQVS
jgi:hypothetical protein